MYKSIISFAIIAMISFVSNGYGQLTHAERKAARQEARQQAYAQYAGAKNARMQTAYQQGYRSAGPSYGCNGGTTQMYYTGGGCTGSSGGCTGTTVMYTPTTYVQAPAPTGSCNGGTGGIQVTMMGSPTPPPTVVSAPAPAPMPKVYNFNYYNTTQQPQVIQAPLAPQQECPDCGTRYSTSTAIYVRKVVLPQN